MSARDVIVFAGGALIFVVQNALAAAAAHLFARRLVPRPEGPLHAALVFASVWASLVVGSLTLLGALGLLSAQGIVVAQAALCFAALLAVRGRPPAELLPRPGDIVRAAWRALERRPATAMLYALLSVPAALLVFRGLTRPPLSWDAIMYHLLLAGYWLQEGAFTHYFAPYVYSYVAYYPANGALMCLWNMAPFHGELLVNLTFTPWWAVLGLAVYGAARELGVPTRAALYGPLFVLPAPLVLRFMHTGYVDIFLAALQTLALYFMLRYRRTRAPADALLLGAALGLAAGTKHLGLPFGALLGVGWLVLTRPKLSHVAAALVPVAALGTFWYARNFVLTGNPIFPGRPPLLGAGMATYDYVPWPWPGYRSTSGSLLNDFDEMGLRQLVEALLGVPAPYLLEMGIGPRLLVTAASFLAAPFALRGEARRWGLLLVAALVVHLFVFAALPGGASYNVFANTRYLVPLLALSAVAGAAAVQLLPARAVPVLCALFLALDLLQVQMPMPLGFRAGVAVAAPALLALAGARARALARGWPRQIGLARPARWALGVAAAAALVFAGGGLVGFRRAHRYEHFRTEYDVHATPATELAPGWAAIERSGAEKIAFAALPRFEFPYPLMGAELERRVEYVNVDAAGLRVHSAYGDGLERTHPDRGAWLRRLEEQGFDTLFVGVNPPFRDFPIEDSWARALPQRFKLVYEDTMSRIYRLH